MVRCLCDALQNLDLSYYPIATAGHAGHPPPAGDGAGGAGAGAAGFAAATQHGAGATQAAAAAAAGFGGAGGAAAAGDEDWEEAAALAAEMGAGLVPGNLADMTAFISLSGEAEVWWGGCLSQH